MDQIGSKNSEAYPLTEGCLHAPFSVTQGNPCLFNTSGVTMTLECSPGNKKKIQKRKIEKFLKRDGYPWVLHNGCLESFRNCFHIVLLRKGNLQAASSRANPKHHNPKTSHNPFLPPSITCKNSCREVTWEGNFLILPWTQVGRLEE